MDDERIEQIAKELYEFQNPHSARRLPWNSPLLREVRVKYRDAAHFVLSRANK